MKRLGMFAAALLTAAAAVSFDASLANAHERRSVGEFETTVGWFEEPAFAGFRNAVQFAVAKGGADEATPVTEADLQVEIVFGGPDATEKTEPLELRAAFGAPGEYRAFLIPTRSGIYTFRIFGTLEGEDFDEVYTSGEDTFNSVQQSADVEFPAADPSRGELAESLERIDERLTSARNVSFGLGAAAILLALVSLVMVFSRKPKATP